MKVYLRDKRVTPRVVYIDGKRYVLPSNKEVVKEISRAAFNNLSAMNCISIREYIEPENSGNIVEAPAEEQPKKEETKPVEAPKKEDSPKDEVKKEEPEVDVSGLVVEDKLEDSHIVSPVEEPKQEVSVEENKEESKPVEEKPATKVDYSSLTKKELKALVEEKGGDPTGMNKANLVDWLNANA